MIFAGNFVNSCLTIHENEFSHVFPRANSELFQMSNIQIVSTSLFSYFPVLYIGIVRGPAPRKEIKNICFMGDAPPSPL